jgi:L-iditol 2-dehydrogenase
VFHGPGDVREEQTPVPKPGPGEVVVRVDAALTDATDAKAFLRGHPVLLGPLPAPFGHEYAGTVSAVGRGTRFAVGERVTGANSAPCGGCDECQRGQEVLCRRLLPLLNGAYAQYLRVPRRIVETNLYRIPETLDSAVAAMCEPLACVLHGVERAEAVAGERMLVVGRGANGQMLAAALRARGGIVTTIGSGDPDPVDGDFDRVIEAAGTVQAWQRAARLTRPGGTCVLFGGLPAATSVAFDAFHLHYQALTLRGAFHHTPRHVRDAVAMLADNPEPFAALITHRFGLEGVVQALEMTAGVRPRDGILKALITPSAPRALPPTPPAPA